MGVVSGERFTSDGLGKRWLCVVHHAKATFIGFAVRLYEPGAQQFQPGPTVQSDIQLLDYARQRGGTVYHPTSTCKMGVDSMAVVDPELKVIGIEGLRVADASVMPTVISGNTNAATIMIGEKLADLARDRMKMAA